MQPHKEDQTDTLIIGDDEYWVRAVAPALRADGVLVTISRTPQAGIDRAAALAPRLILLDLASTAGASVGSAAAATNLVRAAAPDAALVLLAESPSAVPPDGLDSVERYIWLPRTVRPCDLLATLCSLLHAHVVARRDVDAWQQALLGNEIVSVIVYDLDGSILDISPGGAKWLGYERQELLGRKLSAVTDHDPDPVSLPTHLERLRAEGRVRIRTTNRSKAGDSIPLEVDARLVPYRGKQVVLSTAVSLREVEHQKSEVRRAQAGVDAVREIALELAAELDTDRLLQGVMARAIDLVDADDGGFYLYDPLGDVLVRSVSRGNLTPSLGTVRRRNEGLAGRVWAQNAALWVDDYRNWEGRVAGPLSPKLTGVLGVPVRRGGEFLGVLTVGASSERRAPFAAPDAHMLELFAAHAAIALHNARLYSEANRLRSFNEQLLSQMTEGLALDNTEGVFDFVNLAAASMLGYTVAELIGEHFSKIIPPDQMPIVDAANARRRRNVRDRYEIELAHKDGSRVHVMASGAPTYDPTGNYAGTLVVFTDIEARIEAEAALMHRLALEQALTEISSHFIDVSPDGLPDAIQTALKRAGRAVEADRSFAFLTAEDGLTVERGFDWAAETDSSLDPHRLVSVSGLAFPWWLGQLRAAENISVTSLDDLPPEAAVERRILRALRIRSVAAVPLNNGGRFWGFLGFAATVSERSWPDPDVALLRLLAETVAGALARQEATRHLQKQAERLTFVNEVGRALSATLDAGEICDIAHNALQKVIDCPHLIVTLYDRVHDELPVHFVVVDHKPFESSHLPPISLDPKAGPHGRAITSGQTVVLDDIQVETGKYRGHTRTASEDERWPHATLTAPMIVNREVIGTVQIQSYQIGIYTADDAELLGALANQVGLALQNARLLERAREEAQRLHEVMAGVPEGVILVAADGQVLMANPAGRASLQALAGVGVGGTLVELGGKPWQTWLTSPTTDHWHEIVVGQPAYQVFELVARPVVAPSTQPPAQRAALSPSEAPGPTTRAWVMVVRNVTEERSVAQRSHQQERLAAVGQLASGIAHDFNNIMAVIVLYTQMTAADKSLPLAARRRLQTVVEQAGYATDMIQQILDFSRSSVLTLRPLDLAAFLREQVKLMRRVLPESIDLTLTNDRQEATIINADPTRIQQAVMNLAVNARDAMPEGGRLSVSLRRTTVTSHEAPPLPEMGIGHWIELLVTDTGIGMAAEVLPHIFDPFYTTKEPGKGTGLGLAQVHGIVKQHGGEIGVSSRPGRGTTFAIYLPALWVGTDQPNVEAAAPELIRGNEQLILVAEDSAATRGSIVESLQMLGYRTIEAENGRQALSRYMHQGQDPIDLILTDLVMPVAGGKALADTLHQMRSTTPMVILSGHPLTEEIPSLEELGVRRWLQKPISLDALSRAVAEALAPSGSPCR